jgi:TnpA family transposase
MEVMMKHNWTLDELIDNWTLLPNELELVNSSKADHNRLVFTLLLKYFQIEGKFPRHQREIPQTAVNYVARQLKISPHVFQQYDWRGRTSVNQRREIRSFLGFREATTDDVEVVSLWLQEHILPQTQQLDAVRDAVYRRYRTLKIEPPTAGRIERLARSALRQYTEQFCEAIGGKLSTQNKSRLDALLERETIEGEQAFRSPFGLLKTDAGGANLDGILEETGKLERIRQLELPSKLFQDVPPGVVKQYRQRVASEPPREIRRHPEAIRYTLLAAFCHLRSQEITDNLVDLLLGIIKRIGNNAEKRVERKILRDIKRVQGKGRILYEVAQVSIARPDGLVSEVIYPVAGEETLQQIVAEYQAEGSYEQQIQLKTRQSYARHYRRMAPPLLRTLRFRSNNEVHQPLIRALSLIEKYADSQHKYYLETEDVPVQDVVPLAWRGRVIHETQNGEVRINRINYEVCVFQKLRERLRCKEIWVVGAYRYRNPDDDLPQDFDTRRETYYELLQQPLDVDTFVAHLRQDMVDALAKLDQGLPKNPWVELLPERKNPIKLSPLAAQPEPLNLLHLKYALAERWPLIELLDMLKETDLRVNFSQHFQTVATRTELSQSTLQKRLLLCLYALGTNAGFKRMAHAEKPQDLLYIKRRFINKDNLRSAIAEVVNAIFKVRSPHIWGEATTACASDSKKFAAWDQNLLTEWHIRYRGPGIMVYWHIDKKAACIHSQVKGVSSSEVAAMIEGVLHHCTEMNVEKNYVDSHGQSEVAFAFCHLLGFQLLPRLKPISSQRLYLPSKETADDLANLQPVLTRPIRWHLIEQQYDEMVKFATALRLGTAETEAILRRFTRKGPQHPTYKALAELGKAVKTIFLCEFLHSIDLRREIQEGLNVIENWNSANSFIFYGRSSEITTNNREEQEVTVLSMHLLQMCLVYINTLMIQQILAEPDWQNRLELEDLRALTPLIYAHVNPYGRFYLDMDERLPLDE